MHANLEARGCHRATILEVLTNTSPFKCIQPLRMIMTGSQNNHQSPNNSILNIFANTQDGAYAIDGKQTIVFWNQAAEQMLGYTQEEALGKKCWQLMQGHSTEGSNFCQQRCQVIANLAQGKAGENFDLLVQHQNGHRLLVNVSTLPLPHDPANQEQPRLMHLTRFLADQPLQPGRLRIHLLGPTIVWRPDGTLVEGPLWRRIKVRALLVYLVLQRGPVPRESLIEVLWPDLDYEAGLRNLNTTIYNLRRSLEPDLKRGSDSTYIIYEGGNYRLDSSQSHWLDVQAFERGIRQARVERNRDKAIALYKETLALYRGEYLTDLGNTEVCSSGEQHRITERYLAAMEETGLLHEQNGQDEKAKEIYQKIVALDPCRESACQRLMRLLIRQGDTTASANYCRRLNEALRLELNVLPTKETRRLCALSKCES